MGRFLAFALAAGLQLTAFAAVADTFTVTKVLDTRDGACDSDCSLREAVIAANGHPGPDTIMVPAGTYVLMQVGEEEQAKAGDLDVLDDLTFTGAGAEVTVIDGNSTDRVFDIHGAVSVQIKGITVQHGSVRGGAGGGINNDGGTLILMDSIVIGNSATGDGGGISNYGETLTITNCTLSGNSSTGFYGNGGGLYTRGTATLTGCALNNNSTGTLNQQSGGAIYNDGGSLTITHSTFDGNSATHGSAIHNNGGTAGLTQCTLINNDPEGVNNSRGRVTLLDCALSGRTSGVVNDGTLTMTQCTLSGNRSGGGIYNYGAATLTSCTLGDTYPGGIHNLGASATLELTDSTVSGSYGGSGINNQTGMLTLTHCTVSSNVGGEGGGIFNGGTALLRTCRIDNNSADAGQTASNTANGGGISNSGMLSMQDCALNGNSTLGPGSNGGAIYNTGMAMLTNCSLSGNSVTFGYGYGHPGNANGGGVSNSGTLAMTECTLSGNSARVSQYMGTASGGGISNEGTTTLTDCTLSDNSATGDRSGNATGGGISNAGAATLTDCTLSDNSATGGANSFDSGGGVYSVGSIASSILTMTNCTLSGNSASDGGGITNFIGTATLTNCTLSGNSSTASNGNGGGISSAGRGTVTLTNTIIANSLQGRTCDGTLQSGGHNLDDNGACGLFNDGDLSIVPANLAPIGNYGGLTQTIALCAGPGVPVPECAGASPAIGAGDQAACAAAPVNNVDERGFGRPGNGHAYCSMGAYEPDAIAPKECVGDCNGNGKVAINELILGVNIALAVQAVDACSPFANAQGMVNVAQLVKGVNNALNGCGG